MKRIVFTIRRTAHVVVASVAVELALDFGAGALAVILAPVPRELGVLRGQRDRGRVSPRAGYEHRPGCASRVEAASTASVEPGRVAHDVLTLFGRKAIVHAD